MQKILTDLLNQIGTLMGILTGATTLIKEVIVPAIKKRKKTIQRKKRKTKVNT